MLETPARTGPVVIVNPYSSGGGLARLFLARGVPCVAVMTRLEVPPLLVSSWRPQDFSAVHRFDGDFEALAAAVAAHEPRCIVAGFETGVEIADALIDRVLPGTGNVSGMTAARRDKYQMALALQDAGVPQLRQVCSDRHEDVESWIQASGLEHSPLVLKPPKSAGTDDVFLVEAGADWRVYFDRILGKTNMLLSRNDAVLVQEFASGTEYIVDTYSVDGRHGLVDVCRYTKGARGERLGIYESVDFVAPDDPVVATLLDYTQRVLDALGIRNGPAHSEVMLNDDGPVLIEVGARPAGAAHQDVTRLATGDSQLDRCAAHYVDGVYKADYELRRHVRIAFLSSPRAGVLRNAEILDQLDELAAVHSKKVYFGSGDVVPATVDIVTPLGLVVLAAEDEQQICAAYGVLKNLEARLQVQSPVDREGPRPFYAEV
jgi:hypothetical protein